MTSGSTVGARRGALTVVAVLGLHGGPAGAKELAAAPPEPTPAPRHFTLTAVGIVAFAYSDALVSDHRPLGPENQLGLGLRPDARYRPVEWFGVGLGLDYLQGTATAPSRHLAVPVVLSFTPLRRPGFELGVAVGVGPAWSWYPGAAYTLDGSPLRGHGELFELRLEDDIRITAAASILVTVGVRAYGDTFDNASGGGVESPSRAADVGVGVRWSL